MGAMEKKVRKITEKKLMKATMSIIRTSDIVNRVLEIELRKYDSSPARFSVMNALFVHGGSMRPSDISKYTFRAKHSVTSMVKALENIDYIRKLPNENDHRALDIIITERGWEATENMLLIGEELSERILACLDNKEIDTLLDILKQIRKHLLSCLSSPDAAQKAKKVKYPRANKDTSP